MKTLNFLALFLLLGIFSAKAQENIKVGDIYTFDDNTMYTRSRKISIEDEIFIGNICEEYSIDFAIGTNHFTLFNKGE